MKAKDKIKDMLQNKKNQSPKEQNDKTVQEVANQPPENQDQQIIDQLQNPGIFRANILAVKEKEIATIKEFQTILIDLGKQILSRMDSLTHALNSDDESDDEPDDEEGEETSED